MGTNPKKTAVGNVIGKFARTLMATTCLTAASSGAALATTIYPPFPAGENPLVQTPLTVLPADPNPGTTIVNVTQNQQQSWFELIGLGPGTFTFSATSNGSNGDLFNFCSDATFLSCISEGFASSSAPLNLPAMAIPASGDLFVHTTPRFEQANSYTVTVNTQGAPEPSTIAMAGLGLAALVSLSRKKR
jgi:hypothetical protein